MNEREQQLLQRAIDLAATGRAAGEEPFGSLLADADGTVLAEDYNTVRADRDISAHPEFKLAKWASTHLTPEVAATVTLFTSCEPCSMCSGAVDRSGLGRVVFALSNAEFAELFPHAVFASVAQEGPAMSAQARIPLLDFYG